MNLDDWRGPVIRGAGDCPDCLADARVERTGLGVWKVTILHDATCPWLTARTRRIEAARAAIARHEGNAR